LSVFPAQCELHHLTIVQADSLAVLTIGQAFEGVPWGIFIANSPAYASEVVPIPLRGIVAATLQMSWSIGSIIVAGATYGTNKYTDEWAWRLPLALQWLFPVGDVHQICITPADRSTDPAAGHHLVCA
jgi:MFS family permease